MTTIGQRIRTARKQRKMSQAELAAHWGIARVSVTQWEADITKPDPDKIPGLIDLFGGDAGYWLGGDGEPAIHVEAPPKDRAKRPKPNASPPVPIDYPTQRIPMLGTGAGGADGKFVLNGNKVMDALCPPQLVGVPNAYGVFAHGSSMEPRYHPGEAVFVNPHLPVRQGDYVVVQIADEDEGEDLAGFIKRFVSMNSRELVLEQFEPRDEVDAEAPEAERFTLRFARERVFAVHKIVASGIV